MNNNNFSQKYLELTALVTFGIGLVLIFWPNHILQLFIPGANGDFFIRFIGSALLGYAMLNHLSSKAKDREVRRIAIISNLVTLTIATLLSVAGVASGAILEGQLLLIGEHVVFAAGFAYAYVKN